jgi:hypothetical protein
MFMKHETECEGDGGYFQPPSGVMPKGDHDSLSEESST